jgi:hypothetical protein
MVLGFKIHFTETLSYFVYLNPKIVLVVFHCLLNVRLPWVAAVYTNETCSSVDITYHTIWGSLNQSCSISMTMRSNIDRGLRDQAYLCCQPGHEHEIQRPRQQQQVSNHGGMAVAALGARG